MSNNSSPPWLVHKGQKKSIAKIIIIKIKLCVLDTPQFSLSAIEAPERIMVFPAVSVFVGGGSGFLFARLFNYGE